MNPDPLYVAEPDPADYGRPRLFSKRWRLFVRRSPMLWFLWSPVGGAIEHVLWRWKPWKDWTGRHVWAEALAMPGFRDGLDAGLADSKAGRTYSWPEGRPNDRWSPDDPIQPTGWHHDGSSWVEDEL